MTLPASTFVTGLPDGDMHARHWPAPAGGTAPPLLLIHATGMCGAVYADLLGPLAADQARDFAIYLPDMRGHGRTRLPATPGDVPLDWLRYRNDLIMLLMLVTRDLPDCRVRLAGHSFGATVACELAAAQPGRVDALLLLDPAFIPFDHASAYAAARAAGQHPPNPMAEGAARRRPGFPSRAEARARLQHRGVFAGWPDAALEAYLEDGLDEAFQLRCTPSWEATSFRGVSTTLETSLARLSTPFTLLAAAEGSTVTDADFATFRAHRSCRHAARVTGGHFFPVTHPETVRPHLAALMR